MSNDEMCVDPRTRVIITIIGRTIHPLLLISSSSWVYLYYFLLDCFGRESIICVSEFYKLYL